MDIVDVRIFFQAGFKYHVPCSALDRRPSSQTIAHELGIDPKTVETRLRKMERDGFIERYEIIPNYATAGYRSRTYLIPFPDPLSKEGAVERLKLVDGVTRIDEYVNSIAFTVVFKTRHDLQQKLSSAKELSGKKATAGAQEQEILLLEETLLPQPSSDESPSKLTWKIIESMRYNALKPDQEIAQEVQSDSENVGRHLQEIVKSNLIFVVPTFSQDLISKLTLYALLFIPDSTDSKIIERITAEFSDSTYYRIISDSGAIIFLMFGQNLAEAEANYLKAQKILGIKVVLMDFAGKMHRFPETIDRIIRDKIVV